MILSDLPELKSLLQIDQNDTEENKLLLFLLDMASDWIEEYLGRKLFRKERTEYYNGTGNPNLMLKSRPVLTTPTIQVWVDGDGNYGATSGAFATSTALVYGEGFTLAVDQDDGTSRSGILVRIGDYWDRPRVRSWGLLTPYIGQPAGNVKVTYTGGYTIDNLPSRVRLACATLVAQMRSLLPEGLIIGSESYEERHIAAVWDAKRSLISTIRPMIGGLRNWSF